jgi:tetratricopeptide (TPR) repeat protein
MKNTKLFFIVVLPVILICCKGNNNTPSANLIKAINLKRGTIISCGPPDAAFGTVSFETSCPQSVKADFDLAVSLLHSFEYDEAEKAFAKVIDEEPACAMAYWGVAMSNYHPLWSPPTQAELEKGAKAIAIARSLTQKSKKENGFIQAAALFYNNWQTTDHRSRSMAFAKAMEQLYSNFANDKEAATFYALALTATASPTDKTFSNQKKAGAILNALYPGQPNHPGIVHYIIHTYDAPELANLALDAAKKYAAVAPSSAHALHMPSHIFTRLGLWDECIKSNLASVASAQCYATAAGITGHWDEELHGLDYLIYAYLQKGQTDTAKQQLDYLNTIKEIHPANFKVAYAFAAIPSRYVLENKLWVAAASLEFPKANFNWKDFPMQKAIIHFTRSLGAVNTNQLAAAKTELGNLKIMHDTLLQQKDSYKADQVQVEIMSAEAWILFKEGKNREALQLMTAAADMEDKTEKHPVTPAEVIPARELLADMLLAMHKPAEAFTTYTAVLKKQPNRFNALYNAGLAAALSGNKEKANYYYRQLTVIAAGSPRPELQIAVSYLKNENL